MLTFCQQRQLSTQGLRLIQLAEVDASTHLVTRVTLEIQLPRDFPEKYREAVTRAAEQCKISKQLQHPPVIEVMPHAAERQPA